MLEELRLLTNYNMDAENRLCLLLLGQSELRRRLSMAVHEALSQRIVVRYHLSPLTREELPAYLTHRLRCAGTELPIFEPPAQEALAAASPSTSTSRDANTKKLKPWTPTPTASFDIAIVRDATNTTFYLNGSPDGSAASVTINDGEKSWIGGTEKQ